MAYPKGRHPAWTVTRRQTTCAPSSSGGVHRSYAHSASQNVHSRSMRNAPRTGPQQPSPRLLFLPLLPLASSLPPPPRHLLFPRSPFPPLVISSQPPSPTFLLQTGALPPHLHNLRPVAAMPVYITMCNIVTTAVALHHSRSFSFFYQLFSFQFR